MRHHRHPGISTGASGRRRLPEAPLLTEDGVQPGGAISGRGAFGRPLLSTMRRRREEVGFPQTRAPIASDTPGSANCFRYNGVDPLTVAGQTGASLVMIERRTSLFQVRFWRSLPYLRKGSRAAAWRGRSPVASGTFWRVVQNLRCGAAQAGIKFATGKWRLPLVCWQP